MSDTTTRADLDRTMALDVLLAELDHGERSQELNGLLFKLIEVVHPAFEEILAVVYQEVGEDEESRAMAREATLKVITDSLTVAAQGAEAAHSL